MTVGTLGAIGVALKFVCLRPEIDALTGAVEADERYAGMSDADLAALSLACELGELWNTPVLAVTVSERTGAETVLRDALAAGASDAVRVEASSDSSSDLVAQALAGAFSAVDLVVCGDVSADRGSGAVPAFLAAELGMAQALGLVAIDIQPDRTLRALRRLDGGRREDLLVRAPAVVSVEGAVRAPRRASLAKVLQARDRQIRVEPFASGAGSDHEHDLASLASSRRPFRPRAHVVPAPEAANSLERVRALLSSGTARPPVQRHYLDASEAALLIRATLEHWGELPASHEAAAPQT